MLTDDLPWPELGNVSRGATRGNQGQKGVLGAPDNEGRCTLQLRVQPGVLAVRLNRQASDWYRILDNEVNRALKQTKSYWRKARRRQDYDARADQDHMELHEWLQQLKDKVMSHLELLMQKGEIQGPPYLMPDNVELTFLCKFIERQTKGISHNPRIRRAQAQSTAEGIEQPQSVLPSAVGSSAPLSWSAGDDKDDIDQEGDASPAASSSQLDNPQNILDEINSNRKVVISARASLLRVQRETQEAFALYTSCMDTESRARQQLSQAEERRETLLTTLVEKYRSVQLPGSSGAAQEQSNTGFPRSVSRASTSHSQEDTVIPNMSHSMNVQATADSWKAMRGIQWPQPEGVVAAADLAQAQGYAASERVFASAREDETQPDGMVPFDRKHSRTWEGLQSSHVAHEWPREGLMSRLPEAQAIEDIGAPPPRKRMQMADGTMFSAPRPMSSRDADRQYPAEWASQSQL